MTYNRIVLESVPEKDRAKNINEIDLSEESTVERALGVYWFIEDDKLGFHINVKNQPPTRGGIVSHPLSHFKSSSVTYIIYVLNERNCMFFCIS
jgi:hypothetical protein